MSDRVLDSLVKTRTLLSPPGAWTQSTYARDKAGNEVDPDSRTAVCWCLTGALKAIGDHRPTYYFLRSRANEYGFNYLSTLNDRLCKTRQDILNFLDWTIEYRKWELGQSLNAEVMV